MCSVGKVTLSMLYVEHAEMASHEAAHGQSSGLCLCFWHYIVMGEGSSLFAVLRKINFHLQKMKLPSKILT